METTTENAPPEAKVEEVHVPVTKPDGIYAESQGTGSAEPVKEDAVPQGSTEGGELPGEATKVDEKPPESTEPPAEAKPEEDSFASRFAILAKKEKQIREREKSAKEAVETVKSLQGLLAKKNENPIAVLEALGLDFRQVAEYVLGQKEEPAGPDSEIRQLRQELDAIKAEKKREEESLRNRSLEVRENQFRGEIKSFVDSKPDDFEVIRQRGAYNMVFDTMESYYSQYGKVPVMEEVAREVESFLEEGIREAMKLKKFTSRNGSATLTSKAQGESQVLPKKPVLDPEESKREAARLLRWND